MKTHASPGSAARAKKSPTPETAESMSARQREIAVSEFFLKNRHLLGFDSPRRALLTAVKEAVDNSMDACEEAGIVPEISVELEQIAESRFRVTVTDNGPGIVKAQIPKIFAKLLYGSKFHRLRMSRGQQGIGISAAGMYGQLTTGAATRILSKVKNAKSAHQLAVQIDTKSNKPVILADEEVEWKPAFQPVDESGAPAGEPTVYAHGTCVSIDMEAQYQRGKQSVDEFIKQCAIVNPHLTLHYRIRLLGRCAPASPEGKGAPVPPIDQAQTFPRALREMPKIPSEIMPHPHGVELGLLMQMLKDSESRTVRSALASDFSRVSDATALQICERAGVNPKANPTRVAHQEAEALFKAIQETKLMRPPTDCLSPIGEAQIVAGLQKEIQADYYTAVTRDPEVYRGNPFQIEVGLAYAKPEETKAAEDMGQEEPIRLLRFANRVPLLYQPGACAITKAVIGVNWKAYGLNQPKGALPLGPLVLMVHMASVWVPFTSESKDAIASYEEILAEMTLALQECGRRLSVFLNKRRRDLEAARKRNYIELYIPHLALGLKDILGLPDSEKARVERELKNMLEKTHLDV